MRIAPKDVVTTYKAVRSVVEMSDFAARRTFLVFFIQRMSLLCISKGLVSPEKHNEYIDVFYSLSGNLDEGVAKNYANVTKYSAESAGTDQEETLDVGYFSILCYSYTFLLTHQNDYVNYASDRYLEGIESYLIDREGSELYNEITNIELLTEAIVIPNVGRDSAGLLQFGAWAISVPIGQKLPEFAR